MKLAPIVLFAFKRPSHTKQLLESLSQNPEARESELFVFIDGPRSRQEDEGRIKEVESIVRGYDGCKHVHVSVNVQNKGVPFQVINTVTRFCAEYGRVIVLEDDLVLSPFFLRYMNAALGRYADEESVMEITGYMYPIEKINIESGFMRGSCGWGWGTWQRAWSVFNPDGSKLLAKLSDRKLRYEFNFRGSYKYYSLLRDQTQGKIGGWDIRWAASIFLNNGLTLYPSVSFVRNIGQDGTGTNSSKTDKYETALSYRPVLEFPPLVGESEEMLLATIRYFRKKNHPVAKIQHILKSLLNKSVFNHESDASAVLSFSRE